MVKFMKFIWQLPQNILGWLLTRLADHEAFTDDNLSLVVYYSVLAAGSGVSLGNYIILSPKYKTLSSRTLRTIVRHEYGHQRQSLYLGPLYLIAVGIPSFVRNIYHRIAHKKWTTEHKVQWYYSSYPENWADSLGGVER